MRANTPSRKQILSHLQASYTTISVIADVKHVLHAARTLPISKWQGEMTEPAYRIYKRALNVNASMTGAPRSALSTAAIKRRLAGGYRPRRYPGSVIYFKCAGGRQVNRAEEWAKLAGSFTLVDIACEHNELIEEPHVRKVAYHLRQIMTTARFQ